MSLRVLVASLLMSLPALAGDKWQHCYDAEQTCLAGCGQRGSDSCYAACAKAKRECIKKVNSDCEGQCLEKEVACDHKCGPGPVDACKNRCGMEGAACRSECPAKP